MCDKCYIVRNKTQGRMARLIPNGSLEKVWWRIALKRAYSFSRWTLNAFILGRKNCIAKHKRREDVAPIQKTVNSVVGQECGQGMELRSRGSDGCEDALGQRLHWNPPNTELRHLISHQIQWGGIDGEWRHSFSHPPLIYLEVPRGTKFMRYTDEEDTAMTSRRLLRQGEKWANVPETSILMINAVMGVRTECQGTQRRDGWPRLEANREGVPNSRLAHQAAERSLEGESATDQGQWKEKQHFRDSCGGPGEGSGKLI